MTEKRFISKGESIINVATDELVNASSEESAEIIVMWLNAQHGEIQSLKKQIENNIDSFKRSRSRRIQVEEENKQLKSYNMELEDYLARLEEKILGLEKALRNEEII